MNTRSNGGTRRPRLDQVAPLEPDHPTDRLLDLPLHARPREVPHEEVRGQPPVHLELTVPPAPSAVEHRSGDVGAEDRQVPRRRAPGSARGSPSRSLYGSCPVEHPADQIDRVRVRAPALDQLRQHASCAATRTGEVAEERRLVRGQRVDDAARAAPTSLRGSELLDELADRLDAVGRATSGSSRDSARYSLPGSSTIAVRSRISFAQEREVFGGRSWRSRGRDHEAAPASTSASRPTPIRRTISPGNEGSGSAASASPARDDEPGHAPDDARRLVLDDQMAAGLRRRPRSRAARRAPSRSARSPGAVGRSARRPSGTADRPTAGTSSRAGPS